MTTTEGFNKEQAAIDKNYHAYRNACANGHLHIIQHLEAIEGFDKKQAIMAHYDEAYREACYNGHLHIIQHLETIEGFDKKRAAMTYNYHAYRKACANGHLHIIQHLESIEGFDKKQAAMADGYDAYFQACINGHLHIIEHLETIKGFDKKQMAMADNYGAYRYACSNGHLDIIQHLEAIEGFDKKQAAMANNYGAYRHACSNGHLDIIQHLEAIEGFDKKQAAMASNYDAYCEACSNGHLHIIQHLEAIEGFDKKEAAMYDKFYAYFSACYNGHLHIIQHFEAIEGFDKKQAVMTHNNDIFCEACTNGHLHIIQHLEAIEGFDIKEAATADRYNSYFEACSNGHLHIIQHLEEIDGFDKKAAIYSAYRTACSSDQLHVIQHFLADSDCLAYAESHDQEHGKRYIYDWVDLKLSLLTQAKATFQSEHPDDVFNVSNEDARYYFYMLRNLIRRGVERSYAEAENTNSAILSLLEIPSVKAICHQRVSENGQENELLRFAVSIGNNSAALTLLTIPAVRELAAQNTIYQQEQRAGADLRRLAQDNESSMTALTEGEKQRLTQIEQKYGALQQEVGIENAFSDLKLKLENKYNANPATIVSATGEKISLPCHWPDFNALRLTGEDKEEALKAYYKNETHAALRYLSKPNHWIAQNSSWVNVNPNNHQERWSTFEKYKQLITLMYLAAIDENAKPTQGHTIETRFEHFIRELALIGRAHNWDQTRERLRDDGRVIHEAFDDLGPDQPSCFSGVKRRLFQSLVGHADFEGLTPEVIEQELQSFYRQEVKSLLTQPQFTTDRLQSILADFYRMSAGGDCDYEQFLLLNVPEEKKAEFKTSLERKYGNALTEFMFLLSEKLETSDQGDFLKFATAFDLLSIINHELENRSDSGITIIKNASSIDEVVAYTKGAPSIEGKENPPARAFDIMMPPGQFRAMVDKLSAPKLAEVFQIGNQSTAHNLHQLLLLDQDDFKLLLSKLDKRDAAQLFSSKDELGTTFIYSALASVDLNNAAIEYILSDEKLKASLLSNRGLEHILNVNELNNSEQATEEEVSSSRFRFFTTQAKATMPELRIQLYHALTSTEVKLTHENIDALKKDIQLQGPISLIAQSKGMDIDEFYISISDSKPSASVR